MLLEGFETLWSGGWISILVCAILRGKTNTNTATELNTKQHQPVSGVGSVCVCVSYEVTFQLLRFPSSPLISIASFSADIRKKQHRLFLNACRFSHIGNMCANVAHFHLLYGAQSDAFLSFYVFHSVNLFQLILIWRTSPLHETLTEIVGWGKKLCMQMKPEKQILLV